MSAQSTPPTPESELVARLRKCGCAVCIECAATIERLHSAHEQGRREGWRCFHCSEVFTDRAEAAAHFGWSEHSDVACRLNECEGGVVALLRQAHAELSAYRDEDTKLIREVYGLGSKHQTEKREQEELGYSRGLADSRALSSAPPGEKGERIPSGDESC